jgi:hypothetical protein
MNLLSRKSAVSVATAVVLSLVISSQALAHTWSSRKPLTSATDAKSAGVVGLTSSNAVAAYLDWNGTAYDVDVSRSTNSGSNWGAAKTLSTSAREAAISGLDPYVDVVWSTQNGTFRYARSVDGGKNFGSPVTLSYSGGYASHPHVARGPNGLVVIAWQEKYLYTVFARVSTDGGVTFGNSRTFTAIDSGGTSVAAGNGVAYVGYQTQSLWINVATTADGGVTWDDPNPTTSSAFGADEYSLTASGNDAYIAYGDYNPTYPQWDIIRYRRTTNAGLTWSNARQVSASSWKTGLPSIEVSGGVERVVYIRKTSTGYSTYYQQSSDGLSWSNAELVDSGGEDPLGVARAGKIIVQFRTGSGPSGNVYVRTGS